MHPLPRLALAAAIGLALLLEQLQADGHDPNSGEHAGEGGSASAPATYLTTSGISRGVFSGPEVQADDYYADKLNDLEFALSYDSTSGSFLGRVKNEANEGLCDSRIKVIFDGSQANSQSLVIPSLEVRERATFTLTADSGFFTAWSVETETFTCNNTPVHGASEGGEGGASEGGEGGHEAGPRAARAAKVATKAARAATKAARAAKRTKV